MHTLYICGSLLSCRHQVSYVYVKHLVEGNISYYIDFTFFQINLLI